MRPAPKSSENVTKVSILDHRHVWWEIMFLFECRIIEPHCWSVTHCFDSKWPKNPLLYSLISIFWYTDKGSSGAFSTIIFSTWQLQISWCADPDPTASLAILDSSQKADHKRPDVSAQRRRFQNLRVCLYHLCLRGILPSSPYNMDEGLWEGSPSTCRINWRCQRSRSSPYEGFDPHISHP